MTNRTCSVPGCERKHAARGYCRGHYYQKRGTGELVIPTTASCPVEDCGRPVESRGHCKTHAWRLRKYGTTDAPPTPPPAPKFCTVDGCDKPYNGRGMCQMHLRRWNVYGTTDLPSRTKKVCSVPGCERKYRCSGYCGVHYSRVRATGDPGPVESLQAPQGRTCVVEGCDSRATYYGQCGLHHRREKILAEVAANPKRRIHTWATTDERLRRVGWTERMVRPDLGPCWEWNGLRDKKGYGRVALKGRVMRFAHRVAYQEWVGHVSDELSMCHHCDNPPCINPAHLFPGNHLVNMSDAALKDRTAYGERQGTHKLKEAEVVAIRERYARERITYGDLAAEYGVCRQTIINLLKGKTWARAGGPLSLGDNRDGGRNAGRSTR